MKKIVPLLGIAIGLPLLLGGGVPWLAVGVALVVSIAVLRRWLDADLQTHDPDVRSHYKETH